MTERIPRASISVLFFSDADTLALMARGPKGERAVLMFIQLLVEAKDQRNNGEFVGSIDVYSRRMGLTPDRAKACAALINDVCEIHGNAPWIELFDNGFRIRSFKRFNNVATETPDGGPAPQRGGTRPGAGRKNNQPEIDKAARVKARNLLYRAIQRGEVDRPKQCEICERPCKPNGHHHDYALPFDVAWLCTACHGNVHRSIQTDEEINQTGGEKESNGISNTRASVTGIGIEASQSPKTKDKNTPEGGVLGFLLGLGLGGPSANAIASCPTATVEACQAEWDQIRTARHVLDPPAVLATTLARLFSVVIPSARHIDHEVQSLTLAIRGRKSK